jgi:hypothetical protein
LSCLFIGVIIIQKYRIIQETSKFSIMREFTEEMLRSLERRGTTVEDFENLEFPDRSSNPLNDVLTGENLAVPLLDASSAGDTPKLRSMLEEPSWVEIALQSQQYVHRESRPAKDKDDVRPVYKQQHGNIERAIFAAAKNGHAETILFWNDFALQHGLPPGSFISRDPIKHSIEHSQVAVFEALFKVDPSIIVWHLDHKYFPLDRAMERKDAVMVATILELSRGRKHFDQRRGTRLQRATRLAGMDILQMLIQHEYTVPGSGAIQVAAARGALEKISLLVEHGADVNEICPADKTSEELLASWAPLHYAASCGKEEAMELLMSLGASPDVLDLNGKTPRDLLEDYIDNRGCSNKGFKCMYEDRAL